MKNLLSIAVFSTVFFQLVACNQEDNNLTLSESSATTRELTMDRGERGKPSPEKIIKRLDTDGDGQISRAEAEKAKRGRLSKHFDEIDADGDGFLSLEELTAKLEEMKGKRGKRGGERPSPAQVIEHLDTDGDGQISRAEAEEAPRGKLSKHFDKIDADGDGFLSLEELTAKLEEMKGKRGERPSPAQVIEHLDTDGDGQISRAEAEEAPRGRLSEKFDEIDSSGDGFLTVEELTNFIPNR